MSASGRTVVMLLPTGGGVAAVADAAAGHLRERGWTVRTVHVARTRGSALRVAAGAVRRHRAALRDADVVHAEFGRLDAEVFWAAALLVRRRPVVLVAHDAPDHPVRHPGARIVGDAGRWRSRIGYRLLSPLADRWIVRWVLRRARVGVVLTEEAGRSWRPSGPDRIVVAPHGADAPTAPAVPPSEGRYVLFAGFLGPGKGLDVLLDAWSRVAVPGGLPLRIAGAPATEADAAWVAALRGRAWDDGTEPEWLGSVGDEDWGPLFARAAIVVLPYRASNPASGILVRAMVEGRPVIGTPVPAMAAVGDEEALDLVPVGEVEPLAAALGRLLASPEARDELGARAGRRAAELWSWDRQVAALEAAYADARGGDPGR